MGSGASALPVVVLVAEQGFEMGRPSIVRTVLNTAGGEVTGVSVGGYAALRLTGEFHLGNPPAGVTSDPFEQRWSRLAEEFDLERLGRTG